MIVGRKLWWEIMLVLSFGCGFLGSVYGENISKMTGDPRVVDC